MGKHKVEPVIAQAQKRETELQELHKELDGFIKNPTVFRLALLTRRLFELLPGYKNVNNPEKMTFRIGLENRSKDGRIFFVGAALKKMRLIDEDGQETERWVKVGGIDPKDVKPKSNQGPQPA